MRQVALLLVLASLSATPHAAPAQDREPVREFVTAQYYHGLPRDQAEAYGPEAVPELLAILEDPAAHDSWDQVVDMLSIVGDERATPALTEFFERRFEGTVTLETFQALTQVPRALGAIASRGDPEAEAWLDRGLRPEAWRERPVAWTIPALEASEKPAFLSKLSIDGMARVGTRTSLERLRRLERTMETLEAPAAMLRPALEEAIATNELIIERGVDVLRAPQLDELIRERVRSPAPRD